MIIIPFEDRTVVNVEKLVKDLLARYARCQMHLFYMQDQEVASIEQTNQLIAELRAYIGDEQ